MDKISASFELISHPDRTLVEHLGACNDISKRILALKSINESTFYDKSLVETMRHLLVYFHDFGKGSFFQYKIIEATENALNNTHFKEREYIKAYIEYFNKNRKNDFKKELQDNIKLGNHAKLGSYFVVLNFEHNDIILKYILLKIIRRHHGNLTNFFTSKKGEAQIQLDDDDISFLGKQIEKQDFELYQKILSKQNLNTSKSHWEQIKSNFSSGRQISKTQSSLNTKKEVKYFFLQHFLFSLLLSADKGDMMIEKSREDRTGILKENELLPLSIIDDFKEYKHKEQEKRKIDITREEAYNEIAQKANEYANHGFFSITLPTGLGKTYAAYNVAVILQNAFEKQYGQKPRIVYVLPFTSIIDQNEAILHEILEKSGIENLENRLSKNHYLSNFNDKYDSEELNRDEPEYLADGWEHDVIVTTFVQMLETIFTDRNRTLRKFHNMTNAVFILDEVQSIPPQYFEVVELVFRKMNEYFGTKFVFVTATQPLLFENDADIVKLADAEKYFQGLTRITLDQSLLKQNDYKPFKELNDFTDILVQDIRNQKNDNKSFLIICNTIKSSQLIYKKLTAEFGDIIYLSSSILPVFRKDIISKIKATEGFQIVVSTQVVEAGVDIDLDIVYRDFAPIDSINQSAGRCNRNGEKGGGVVKLFNLGKQKSIYDAVLLDRTEKILRGYGENILEAELFNLNIKYAQEVRKGKAENNDASLYLIQAMQELRTEDIAQRFKLIEEDYRHYNVFIPYCDKAKEIWNIYVEKCKIENDYDRKREIKKIKPQLLQYVTRFPKNKYNTKSEASIIKADDWESYYDLKIGFKHLDDTTFIV